MSALKTQIDTPRLSGTFTSGNFLSATADNGVQDSGSKAADFATAAQGATADAALPGWATGANWTVQRTSETGGYRAVRDDGTLVEDTSFSTVMNTILGDEDARALTIHLKSSNDGDTATRRLFIVDAPIYIYQGVRIIGEGNPLTFVRAETNADFDYAFVVGPTTYISTLVTFENIRFSTDSTAQTGDVGAIEFRKVAEPCLRNCEFTGWTGPAVLYSCDTTYVHWAVIDRSWFLSVVADAPCIKITTPGTVEFRELMIHDSWFQHSITGQPAIEIDGDPGCVQFDNCRFLGAADRVLLTANGGHGLRIANSFFRGYTGSTAPIQLAPDAAADMYAYFTGNHATLTDNGSTAALVSVNANVAKVYFGGNEISGFTGGLTDASAAQVEAVKYGEIDATAISVGGVALGTAAYTAATAYATAAQGATADAALPETQALTFDGAKAITVTKAHTVVNAAMSATATLTLNDPATATRPYRLDVVFTQDATGSRVLTLAGNVTAPGSVQPILTTTANAVDVLNFIWTGAKWRLIGATFAQGAL